MFKNVGVVNDMPLHAVNEDHVGTDGNHGDGEKGITGADEG